MDLAENVPGIIYQWFERANGECGYYYVSPRSFDLYGVTPEELIEDWRALPIHPDDMERWAVTVRNAVEERCDWSFEGRFVLPNGEPRWFRGVSKPVHIDEQEVVFSGVIIDIEDQKKAEDRLRRNEQRLELVLRSAELGQWDWDVETGLVYFDEQYARLLGYELEELAPHVDAWREKVHPGDWGIVTRRLERSHRPWSDELYEAEYRMKNRDGDWIWILARGRVTDWGCDGRPLRMIGVSQDVTKRKEFERRMLQAKEAAEAADRAKSNFLTTISHELRTPLNAIIGFTKILVKKCESRDVPEAKTFLEKIQDNGLHLLAIINDLLDLSKAEAGHLEIQKSLVNVKELAKEIASRFERQIENRPVTIQIEAPAHAMILESDENKLRQVLVNLVGNAVKFTKKGSVTIRLIDKNNTPLPERIEIEDTGIGIERDQLNVIFEAFQQAETGLSRSYGGTGLGLSICRSLCNLLGYRIDVISQAGRGSTFRVWFS